MLAYSGKGSFVIKPMDLGRLVEGDTHLFRSSVAGDGRLNVSLDGRCLPSGPTPAVQQGDHEPHHPASEAIGREAGMIIPLATERRTATASA